MYIYLSIFPQLYATILLQTHTHTVFLKTQLGTEDTDPKLHADGKQTCSDFPPLGDVPAVVKDDYPCKDPPTNPTRTQDVSRTNGRHILGLDYSSSDED